MEGKTNVTQCQPMANWPVKDSPRGRPAFSPLRRDRKEESVQMEDKKSQLHVSRENIMTVKT